MIFAVQFFEGGKRPSRSSNLLPRVFPSTTLKISMSSEQADEKDLDNFKVLGDTLTVS
jgi:hypothetical protein